MPIAVHNVFDHQDPDEFYWNAFGGVSNGRPNEIPDRHRAAIGGFLFVCADLEAGIILRLRVATGMPDNIARAVIGTPKISEALASLSRLLPLNGLSGGALNLFNVWKQRTTYIFAVRNVMAHQSPAWRPDWLRYHFWETARDISDPAKLLYVCKVEEIENLARFAREQRLSINEITCPDSEYLQRWEGACALYSESELPPDPRR